MLIYPWIDIMIVSLVVYLLEYSFYKYKKANIYEIKYMIIWWIIDLWLLMLFWFLYYWKNYVFPFWMNWFWYSFVVSLTIEFAVIQLFQINLLEDIDK